MSKNAKSCNQLDYSILISYGLLKNDLKGDFYISWNIAA